MALQITWKDGTLLGMSLACAGLMWWNSTLRRDVIDLRQTIVTKESELVKIKTQLQEHTESITEITKLPDGTTTTKITKVKDKAKVSEESADKEKVSKTDTSYKEVKNDKSRYIAFALSDVSSGSFSVGSNYTVGAGARLGDLPLFGVVSGRKADDGYAISAGVQVEW